MGGYELRAPHSPFATNLTPVVDPTEEQKKLTEKNLHFHSTNPVSLYPIKRDIFVCTTPLLQFWSRPR